MTNWCGDTMQWHGYRNDPDWYKMYMEESLKVKLHNTSRMGGKPKGIYTIRNFKKISVSEAELVVNLRANP